MTSRFDRERSGFVGFREEIKLKPLVLTEMEKAIDEVFWTYDTSIRENRFIVGGVVEFIVGAALRACGVSVRHKGLIETDIDLLLDNSDVGYSLKAIFKGSGTHLVNTLGEGATVDRWQTGTIFVVTGVGLVYADPDLEWWLAHRDECLTARPDAIVVKKACIVRFAREQAEWVVPCRLPSKDGEKARLHPTRTASADLAAQVLIHYPKLHAEFGALRPGEETEQ